MPSPCPHQTCNPSDALWLPRLHEDDNTPHMEKGLLSIHHYCRKCGLIKVDGDGRGRKAGFYISLLSAFCAFLKHNRSSQKLTKVDIRLICQEIRSRDIFGDPYGTRRTAQDKIFIEIVLARRRDLDRKIVREFVEDFRIGCKKRKRPRSTWLFLLVKGRMMEWTRVEVVWGLGIDNTVLVILRSFSKIVCHKSKCS